MTPSALWSLYVARNPGLAPGGRGLSQPGARKMFDATWTEAQKEARRDVERELGDVPELFRAMGIGAQKPKGGPR